MQEIEKKIQTIESPTQALNSLRLKGELEAPNAQRESIATTIRRMKAVSTKRFTCRKVNEQFFTIKRIQ